MAETIFPKPLDQEVASINAHLANLLIIQRVTSNPGVSIPSGEKREISIDISSYRSAYNYVSILGDASADGSNYANFTINYAYISGNNVSVSVLNSAGSAQTLNTIGVSILCAYPR